MDLTQEQLEALRRIIHERRESLAVLVHEDVARTRDETYAAVAGEVADTGDEAVADLLSDLDNAEVSRDLHELREIEAAQARIAEGTFSTCIQCGAGISFERLLAYPIATRCFECQSVHEKTYAHASESTL
jgi:RNA polymerase-binding protein DksA